MRAICLNGLAPDETVDDNDPGPRPLPYGCDAFFQIAARLGLSCPMGRALYAVNRKVNGWRHGVTAEHLLRNTRQETAERWLQHWRDGGSIRALNSRRAS